MTLEYSIEQIRAMSSKDWNKFRHHVPWLQKDGTIKAGYLTNVNPFTFFLLKEFIEIEAHRWQMVDSKQTRIKSTTDLVGRYIESQIEDTNKRLASYIYRRITQDIWPNMLELNFLESDLDIIVRSIRFFGRFGSWEDFNCMFAGHPFSIEIEQKHGNKIFRRIPPEEQTEILGHVNLVAATLTLSHTRVDKKKKQNRKESLKDIIRSQSTIFNAHLVFRKNQLDNTND